MVNDLTNSQRDRQNILNNRYALEKVEEHLALGGIVYEDAVVFTKQQLVALFEISESTIEKYLASHAEELKVNGYKVLKGQTLKNFLNTTVVTDYGSKTTVLSIFTFRAVLNIAMLLTESDRARLIRSRILDIVIEVVAERSGGHTKYINQRDCDYLPLENARIKMASRDLSFRDALHQKLESYIQTVPEADFDKFLGEASRSLEEQLADPKILDVFKRLKDR